MNLKIPEKVGRYHKLIVKHRDYEREEKRLKKEADRNPHRYSVYMNRDKPVVLNTWHISDTTLPKYYLICDTLFKALEEAGCSIAVDKERILVNIKTDQEVTDIFDKSNIGHTVYADQFTIALHFRDKNIRTKNAEGKYPSHIDEPTGYFRCEVTGRYPWDDRNYGIEKTFQGKYEVDELIKLIFSRIFELAKLLHEAKIEHDKEVAERKRKEAELERLKKNREREFQAIKELIYEYKMDKELHALTEFIKRKKVPKATMEEVLWYKKTLKWLENENHIENGLNEYQHEDLIKYLLDETFTKDIKFNDNSYRW
ncbi:hypothetical protein ERX27_09355 [Macrococcus brunensis]|uniref:Uncharacterized protein n=1 Tax=Macrococcus brunensis TaxID=198483 RepID=A0A4V3BD52_9STAP|nr:hypothetical protein [Macrococcus brunensis]TDL94306.1 hypothetical protein ERX27_09355 [Macrococcus brunensis]